MSEPKSPTTVIRLAQSVADGNRYVDAVVFAGAPGCEPLPLNERDGDYELDALEMLHVMARRTGLARSTIEKLATADFTALAFALFLPPRPKATIIPLDERRKARK